MSPDAGHRRLGTGFGRKADLFATHIWVATISIISGGSPPPKLSSAGGSGEIGFFTVTWPAHKGGRRAADLTPLPPPSARKVRSVR